MTPPKVKKAHYCADCGADITAFSHNAKLCRACTIEHSRQVVARQTQEYRYKKLYGEKKLQQLKDRNTHKAGRPFGTAGASVNITARQPSRYGSEYPHQNHSADGKTYIINFRGRWIHIEKLCLACGRRDDLVRGRWAPIYSLYNDRGHEDMPVLLCLPCYNKACNSLSEREAS